MSKKIILLALAAASVAAFALPAMAMAEDAPLHLVPQPIGTKTVDGEGTAVLTSPGGNITCTSSNGTVTFSTSTTGTFEQTFHGCTGPFKEPCTTSGQPSGTITTTQLPFHLVTVEDSVTHATGPGVLVTPNETTGDFAHFTCGFINVNVAGNGLIGTITNVACGASSSEPTIEFSSSSANVQTHKTVVGTTTEYSLTSGGSAASEDASGKITLGEATKLECT